MIYGYYNESSEEAPDMTEGAKNYGISIPRYGSCLEQSMYLAGIAESAMMTAFERLSVIESKYFGDDYVTEGFEAVQEFFHKVLETISKKFKEAIQWVQDKMDEFASKLREKKLERIIKDLDMSKVQNSEKYKVDGDKTLLKANTIIFDMISGKIDLVNPLKVAATKASTLATAVLNGTKKFQSSSDLKVAAAKELFDVTTSAGNVNKDIKEKILGKGGSDQQKEIKVKDINDNMVSNMKDIILKGKQKHELQRAYEDEKKAINTAIYEAKKAKDKDTAKDTNSRIAQAKDIILTIDMGYKCYLDASKARFALSRNLLIKLASFSKGLSEKDASELAQSNENPDEDAYVDDSDKFSEND